MKATEEMCEMTLQEEKELMLYLSIRHRIYLNRRHNLRGEDGVYRYETVAQLHKRIAPHLLDAEALARLSVTV